MRKVLFILFLIFTSSLLISIPNSTTDLDSGLIGYYPFNGNANDESGNEVNGIVEGATLCEDRFGNENSAYYFNGENSRINLGNNFSFDNDDDFSISVWVQREEGGMMPQSIFSKYSAAENYREYILGITPINNGYYGVLWSPDLEPNDYVFSENSYVWEHFTLIKDDDILKFYNNAELVDSVQITADLVPSIANAYIGAVDHSSSYPDNFFYGKIDELRIYDRVLSQTEIQDLAGNEQNTGIVGIYPFNGNANDSSDNNHNLIVSGATLCEDRFGNENSAYDFDGNNDYIYTDNNEPFAITGDLGISFWMYNRNFDGARGIISFCADDSDNPGTNSLYSLKFWNSNHFRYMHEYDEGFLEGFTFPEHEFSQDFWTHIVINRNSITKELNLYSNSQYLGTFNYEQNSNNGYLSLLRIGEWNGTTEYNRFFDGKLDDFVIKNETFTEAEISELYGNYYEEENLRLAIEQVFSGNNEEAVVPISISDFDDEEIYSVEITLANSGLFDLEGISIEDCISGSLDWDFVINQETMTIVGAGDNPVTTEGTLLQLHILPFLENSTIAINFSSALLNTDIEPNLENGWIHTYPANIGDVDENGIVQAYDSSLIMRYLTGEIDLDETQLANADCSVNGEVSSLDAMYILQYVAGIIDELPVPAENTPESPQGNISSLEISNQEDFIDLTLEIDNPENIFSVFVKLENIGEFADDIELITNNTAVNYNFEFENDTLILTGFSTDDSVITTLPTIRAYLRDNLDQQFYQVNLRNSYWNEDYNSLPDSDLQFDITSSSSNAIEPSDFKLRNYPNPFNPRTSISYTVPYTNHVNLSIYNIKGQLIDTLVSEIQAPQDYSVEWSGVDAQSNELSNGIYFIKLTVGKTEKMRKMILLK